MAKNSQFINDKEPVSGSTKASNVENKTYDKDLWATRITDIPSNMQKRLDYVDRTDEQPVYVGFAPKGLGEGGTKDGDGWLLYYLEYDESDRLIKLTIAYGNWTDHTTEDYS